MGEAILTRAFGRGSGSDGAGNNLITEIITESTFWSVPKAKNQSFSVRIFGAGGGGGGYITKYSISNTFNFGRCSGGGGGYMNNGVLTLNQGESIQITIGVGGASSNENSRANFTGSSGGTTTFGTYLSATGGEGSFINGGNGGSGGGSSGSYSSIWSPDAYPRGGHGFQFGGGGAYGKDMMGDLDGGTGGNGGKWGGGGGGVFSGIGGEYGGNGGYSLRPSMDYIPYNGSNGTDTTSIESNDLAGAGLAGINCGGGGGYGGNGGDGFFNEMITGGGGGGYGANGGSVSLSNKYPGGGGGGGYGKAGKGGNGFAVPIGKSGAGCGGGGGGYGPGGDDTTTPGYGGGGCFMKNGGNGICIIQYYG